MRLFTNTPTIYLAILGALLLNTKVCAQENLLLNPGFEEVLQDNPKSWYCMGSVDYYRNRTLAKHEKNAEVTSEYPAPFAGENYIGIRAFIDATELIVGRFKAPLQKAQWYKISCRVFRPLKDCNQSVSGIAVVVADSIATSSLWYGLDKRIPYLLLKPQYKSPEPQLIDGFEWTDVFAYYQAKGGERFLWVGNILGANAEQIKSAAPGSSTPAQKGGILHCEYQYYYDEFVVSSSLNPMETLLTIRDITFDVGSTAITQMDDVQMKLLLLLLQDHPSYKVEVTGHTDSDGTEISNEQLSAKRAAAVKLWLTKNGISDTRITAKGQGESKPVVPNDSEANKALNRRVEIGIVH